MEPTKSNGNSRALAKLVILVAIVILAVGVKTFVTKKSNNDTTSALAANLNTSQTNTPSTSSSGATSTANSSYKDGTYSATGSYDSPGGTESITISATLTNGNITNTSAQSGANDSDARQFQSDFIASYKPLVVGKSINSVKLSRVSGSSLTSQGFNEAINKIKNQAKA